MSVRFLLWSCFDSARQFEMLTGVLVTETVMVGVVSMHEHRVWSIDSVVELEEDEDEDVEVMLVLETVLRVVGYTLAELFVLVLGGFG